MFVCQTVGDRCGLHVTVKSSYMYACHYPLLMGYIIKLPIQFLLFLPSSSPAKVIGIDPDTRSPRSAFFLPTLQKVPVQQHSRRKPVFYRFFHSSGTVVFWGNHVETGIRIIPKRVEVHMSKTLKLGLQQEDPALSLFLHSIPTLPPRKQNIPKTLRNVKMIEPSDLEGCRR